VKLEGIKVKILQGQGMHSRLQDEWDAGKRVNQASGSYFISK